MPFSECTLFRDDLAFRVEEFHDLLYRDGIGLSREEVEQTIIDSFFVNCHFRHGLLRG